VAVIACQREESVKNTLYLCSAAAAALLVHGAALADDSLDAGTLRDAILVTASRDDAVWIDDYTGSATVITAEDMERRQVRDIADVLRDVPGVAVSGVPGQTQIRIRGAEANHVLVLVDGIEVADPFSREFDIGTLQAEIGARLEVLRGPQSALFGPEAIGGVIAYETASGRDLAGFGARLEGGLRGTINGAARYGAAGSSWDAALSATVVSTDGQPNARGGTRRVGRDGYTLSAKGSIDIAPGATLRAVGRYVRTEGDFNNQDFISAGPTLGFVIDTPGVGYRNDALYGLIGARVDTLEGRWSHDVSLQFADITRDTFGAMRLDGGSKSDRLKGSYVTSFRFDGGGDLAHAFTFAADFERERFRNTDPFGFAFTGRRQIENIGLVAEYRMLGEKVDLSGALRRDINDRFADATTFRAGAGYRVTDSTRLRVAAGSGIQVPTFLELFGFFDGRFLGNENLIPEKSTGWEVGFDQGFADNAVTLSATYFSSVLRNEIFTTFTPPDFIPAPANRASNSSQRGLELALAAQFDPQWSLNAAYTYLRAREDDLEEVRRAPHIASAALNWDGPDDAFGATLVVRYNGNARDLAFTDPSFIPLRVTLQDFVLVNFNARARLSQGVNLFGRIENLLDERYEQVFSFVSPGRTALIGIEARF
jgi:vitamin B12 transporter